MSKLLTSQDPQVGGGGGGGGFGWAVWDGLNGSSSSIIIMFSWWLTTSLYKYTLPIYLVISCLTPM